MRILSTAEASELLLPLGLRIGNWNELADAFGAGIATHKAYAPPRDALQLYVAARRMLDWLPRGAWRFLQIDNSTFPTDDERETFEGLIAARDWQWDVGEHRSFLFEDARGAKSDQAVLTLLIVFAIAFEWHVHLTSEGARDGQRLALQDGQVYFFGNTEIIASADVLIADMTSDPLRLPT